MDANKTLNGIDNALCAEYVLLMRRQLAGEWLCRHCGGKESDHRTRGGDRCDLYATSRTFKSDSEDRAKLILEAVAMVENLKALPEYSTTV